MLGGQLCYSKCNGLELLWTLFYGGGQIVALRGSVRNQLSQFHCLELSPSEKARTRGVHQWQTGDRRNDSENWNSE